MQKIFEYQDQMNFNASLILFTLIGENAGKISTELREKHRAIPWQDIKDFRNRIVHDYVNIDMFIVFGIIKNGLFPLKNSLESLLKEELKNSTFDTEEYKACIGSKYYKHIDFHKICWISKEI